MDAAEEPKRWIAHTYGWRKRTLRDVSISKQRRLVWVKGQLGGGKDSREGGKAHTPEPGTRERVVRLPVRGSLEWSLDLLLR